MFKNREFGCVFKLSDKYGYEVIKYIKNNRNFEVYLQKLDETYSPKTYLVYEDEVVFEKKLISVKKY